MFTRRSGKTQNCPENLTSSSNPNYIFLADILHCSPLHPLNPRVDYLKHS
jgi:hypothetical protein